ncbi:MAG: hypothetical protein AB1492_00025 [Bacillota bacterium]
MLVLNLRRSVRGLAVLALAALAVMTAGLRLRPVDRFNGQTLVTGHWGNGEGQLGRAVVRGQPVGPQSLALDAAGNLIVADTQNGRLVRFSANGAAQAIPFPAELGRVIADDVSAGPEGRLYVADNAQCRVLVLTAQGELVRVIRPAPESVKEPLHQLWEISTRPRGGFYLLGAYLAGDSFLRTLEAYTDEGQLETVIGRALLTAAGNLICDPNLPISTPVFSIAAASPTTLAAVAANGVAFGANLVVLEHGKKTVSAFAFSEERFVTSAHIAGLDDRGYCYLAIAQGGRVKVAWFTRNGERVGEVDLETDPGAPTGNHLVKVDGMGAIYYLTGDAVAFKIVKMSRERRWEFQHRLKSPAGRG